MTTLHIKGQVCQYVHTGTANCASIPFIGIAVPFNLYGIMQQTNITVYKKQCFTSCVSYSQSLYQVTQNIITIQVCAEYIYSEYNNSHTH